MALSINKEAKKSEEAAKVVAAGEAVAAPIADGVLGSKSNLIEFVAPLGDPSRDDVTLTEAKGGEQKRTVTPMIVGYRFKALEDMEIPDCGADDDFKSNPMSYKNAEGKRAVKAGETFDLTRFETGLLLSPPEFNARCTGGQHEMVVAYTVAGTKKQDGQVARASSVSKLPTISLRATKGSIKDFQMIPVLSFEASKDESGRVHKSRHILPGFEKWEPLCRQAVRQAGSAAPATPKTVRNQGAEAFLRIVATKAKNA